MDDTLRFWVDSEREDTKHDHQGKPEADLVIEILARFEELGLAMRFLDIDGRIGWKASPSLLSHLADLERDAEAELSDVR